MQFDCDSSVQDWLVAPGNRDGGIPLPEAGTGERERSEIEKGLGQHIGASQLLEA